MLQKTTAQTKIASLRTRTRIIQGGTASSKTFSILMLLIHYATQKPQSEISVVSESIPHLRRGAIKDFQKIMVWTGMYKDENFNKAYHKYNFNNGSFIEFFSADQPDRLRGARRHVLFVNECNTIAWESFHQLAIRTSRFIYIDYNPTSEFWAHTELMKEEDSSSVILTYKDNEALEDSIVKEIEKAKDKAKTSSYWANWWKVYGLGEIGSLQGVVFSNWTIIDMLPVEAKLLGIGLDFGYSNDPTTIIEVYSYNGKRILNEKCYQTGLVNHDIAKKLPKGVIIIADSAEPKSIEEIRRHGIMIKGATKGTDSIVFGVQIMQSQEYLVTKKSVNLIKELRHYSWDTDKTGKQLNKPAKGNDHAIDAIRYHEMESLANKNYGQYHIR